MSASGDPLARRLAALALGVALVALVLAGVAVRQGQRYLEDVQTLGRALEEAAPVTRGSRPPPRLEVE
ncbi:MAG: hypothetical protein AAGH15_20210 [Myxococcota bacterium]